jgi:hypothetical protein
MTNSRSILVDLSVKVLSKLFSWRSLFGKVDESLSFQIVDPYQANELLSIL